MNSSTVRDASILQAISLGEQVTGGVVWGVIGVFSVVGHVCLVVTLLSSSRLAGYCNYLVLTLALADLVFTALVVPIVTYHLFVGRWDLPRVVCQVTGFLNCLLLCVHVLTLCSIAFIRYQRYCRFALRCLAFYRLWMPLNVIGVWSASVVLTCWPLYGGREEVQYVPSLCICLPTSRSFILSLIFLYSLASLLLLIFYCKVGRKVRKSLPPVLMSMPSSFDPRLDSSCFAVLLPNPHHKNLPSWKNRACNDCLWRLLVHRRDTIMYSAFLDALSQLPMSSDQITSQSLTEYIDMCSKRRSDSRQGLAQERRRRNRVSTGESSQVAYLRVSPAENSQLTHSRLSTTTDSCQVTPRVSTTDTSTTPRISTTDNTDAMRVSFTESSQVTPRVSFSFTDSTQVTSSRASAAESGQVNGSYVSQTQSNKMTHRHVSITEATPVTSAHKVSNEEGKLKTSGQSTPLPSRVSKELLRSPNSLDALNEVNEDDVKSSPERDGVTADSSPKDNPPLSVVCHGASQSPTVRRSLSQYPITHSMTRSPTTCQSTQSPNIKLSCKEDQESEKKRECSIPILVHNLGDGVSRLSYLSPTYQSSGASFLGGFGTTTKVIDFKTHELKAPTMADTLGTIHKEEMKIRNTLIAILLSFLLPVLPALVLASIYIVNDMVVHVWLTRTCAILFLIHVALTPVIYGWTNLRIRRVFITKVLLASCRPRASASGDTGIS